MGKYSLERKRSILTILAHPDDESYGMGGALVKYHEEGVRLILVTLTDGGSGSKRVKPGVLPDAPLGVCRLKELELACQALGIDRLVHLGFTDGKLHRTDKTVMINKVTPIICEEKPDIILTFHPNGISGHLDHVATTEVTKAAFVQAAQNGHSSFPPHQAKKLYFYSLSKAMSGMLNTIYPHKNFYGLAKEETTTVINTKAYVTKRLEALQCHETQFSMEKYGEDIIAARFYKEYFLRYYPTQQPGELRETDLFEGI